jgi:hypothetical protein
LVDTCFTTIADIAVLALRIAGTHFLGVVTQRPCWFACAGFAIGFARIPTDGREVGRAGCGTYQSLFAVTVRVAFTSFTFVALSETGAAVVVYSYCGECVVVNVVEDTGSSCVRKHESIVRRREEKGMSVLARIIRSDRTMKERVIDVLSPSRCQQRHSIPELVALATVIKTNVKRFMLNFISCLSETTMR